MPPRRNNAKAKQAARATQATSAKQVAQVPVVEQKKLPIGAAVGIDFGTSTITLAAYKSDTFDIIVNTNGERYTPVCVGYSNDEMILGSPAGAIVIRNPSNTIQYINKFLGRKFDSLTDSEKALVDCKIVSGEDGYAAFSIDIKGEEKIISPEALITAFAQSLKTYTEGYWDSPVKAAVLSLPTSADEDRRQRYITAVEAAGFDVLGTIAEPCAAVLSFHYDNPNADRKKSALASTPFSSETHQTETILVVDVGTDSTRTNIVVAEQGLIHLNGKTTTTTGCSGDAIDKLLFNHFAKEFAKENDGLDLTQSKRAVGRLEYACDQVKRTLSASTRAGVQLDGLYQGYDLFSEISRAKFEVFCDPIFNAFSSHLEDTFAQFDGKITPNQITSVVLAGGTTSLSRFTTLIESFFRKYQSSPTIRRHVNICDSIAFGAAKQASLLAIHQSKRNDEVVSSVTIPDAAKQSASVTTLHNKTSLPAYHQTPVTIGKNVYIKTFYNTFILAVPSTASASSTFHSTFVINKPLVSGYSPIVGLYESDISNPHHVTTDNTRHVNTFKLDANAISSAFGSNPEHPTPVTIVIRFAINNNFVMGIDVAYHSKSSTTLQWTQLAEVHCVKPTPPTIASISNAVRSSESSIVEYSRLIAQIQMVVDRYESWKVTPKHQRFIARNDFMTPFITAADNAVEKLQPCVVLPNPFVQDEIKPFTVDVISSLPSFDEMKGYFDQLGQAIADVLHYRKYTAAEAAAELRRTSKAAAAATADVGSDLDYDLDSDDMVMDDDDSTGYTGYDDDLDLDLDLQTSEIASVTDELDLDLSMDDLDVSLGKLSIDGDSSDDDALNLGGDLD